MTRDCRSMQKLACPQGQFLSKPTVATHSQRELCLLAPGPEPCGGGGGGSRGRSGSSSSSEVAMVLMALWYSGVELGMAYLDI